MASEPRAAVREALRAHLAAALATPFPSATVLGSWPTPQEPLTDLVVAITSPGKTEQWHFPLEVYEVVPGASPNGTATYGYAHLTVPLQIDVWAQFEAVRDQVAAAITDAVNKPTETTLGSTSPFSPLGNAPGVVLRASDFYDSPVDYIFDPIAVLSEEPQSVMAADWRATFEGQANLYLVQQQLVPLVKQLSISGTFPSQLYP